MERSCSACAYRNYLGDEHPCVDCDDNRCNFEPMKKTNEYKLRSANRNKMIAMLLGLVASARFYDNDDEIFLIIDLTIQNKENIKYGFS